MTGQQNKKFEESMEVSVNPLEFLAAHQSTDMTVLDILKNNAYVKGEPSDSDMDEYPSTSESNDQEAVMEGFEEGNIMALLLKQSLYSNESLRKLHCSYCDYSTYKITSLKKHNVTHTAEKPFECPLCPYKTNRKPSLKRHSLSHSDIKQFSCPECSFSTKMKRNLSRHMLNHSSEKKLHCPLCGYATNNKAHHRRHMQAHLDKHIKCPHCDYKTHRKDHLQRHLVKHSNPQQLKCPNCDYSTVFKREMTMHALRHTVTKCYACPECPYQTDIKYHYQRHIWVHSSKKFHCTLCQYKTNRSDCLKSHLLAKHYETFRGEEDAEEYLRIIEDDALVSFPDEIKHSSRNNFHVSNEEISAGFATNFLSLFKGERSKSKSSAMFGNEGIPFSGCHLLPILGGETSFNKSLELVEKEVSKDDDSDSSDFADDLKIMKTYECEDDQSNSKLSSALSSPDEEEMLYMNFLRNKLPSLPNSNENISSLHVEGEYRGIAKYS